MADVTAVISNRMTVDGVTYTQAASVDADGVVRKGNTAVAVAKVGQLTTRTDNDTGTLTMNASHGITTGVRLDVFWVEAGVRGARRGMTVGTVSVNSVPVDGGAGDNLPTNLNAVTAQVPTEEAFAVTGNDVQFIFAKASKRACVVFADASNVELHAIEEEISGASGGGYQWYAGNGVTNPLAGDAVAKVFYSNGDSSATNAIRVGVGAN
jgi:hypothetical protein